MKAHNHDSFYDQRNCFYEGICCFYNYELSDIRSNRDTVKICGHCGIKIRLIRGTSLHFTRLE